jgi:hypothetical protein
MLDFLQSLMEWPVYRYGLIFFAVVAFVPAIVSANMTQHLASKIIQSPRSIKQHGLGFLGNLALCLGCSTIIYFAVRIYITN